MLTHPIILALFLASGAASLIYQVLWVRQLSLVLGSGTFAVSAVLTAFMTGLALGAYTFGRTADRTRRPLRLYAAIETGIGLCALGLPFAFSAIAQWYFGALGAGAEDVTTLRAVRLIAALGVLLLPCCLIGGTLPVLVRFVARTPDDFGRDFAWLYGFNTLGAVVGATATGFLLIATLGVTGTNHVAIGLNLALAASFLFLDLRYGDLKPVETPEVTARDVAWTGDEALAVGVAVLSGLTILALEVLWTRGLVHALFSTTTTFTVVLSTILLSLALGSFIAGKMPLSEGPEDRALLIRLAGLELVFALMLLGTFQGLAKVVAMNNGLVAYVFGVDGQVAAKVLTAALVLVLPSIVGGTLLPLSIRVLSRRLDRVGFEVGRIYLANTLAGAAGSLVAGFVLLPLLGLTSSYLLFVGLHAGVAAFLAIRTRQNQLAIGGGAIMLVAAVFALITDSSVVQGKSVPPLAHKETADATYAVVVDEDDEDVRHLSINGFLAASNADFAEYMPMMSHLPLLLHPTGAKRVLVIAFGTGSTAGAATLYPIDSLHIVDFSPVPFEFAPYFSATNHDVLEDPRTTAIVEDGRHYIASTHNTYDVITSEPMPPKFAHMVNFYTQEYYELARARLAPGGIVCQWLPFHLMTTRDARMISTTFAEVFPHSSLWLIHDTGLLIGSVEPLDLEPKSLQARMTRMTSSKLAAELQRLGFASANKLLETLALEDDALHALGAQLPLITEDRPSLDYSGDTPRLTHKAGWYLEELELSRARLAH